MKRILIALFTASLVVTSYAQQHSLLKVWETDSTFKVPESVLIDNENKVLYVSNIDGLDPWGRDNKGSIGKLGMDGKIIAVDWVRGLQAPKGMGIYKGYLYVADLTDVVQIDIKKGEIKKRIPVPYAENLNDISIDPKGNIYVSDSKGKRVYVVKGNDASPYVEGLQGPNGVKWFNENLYILDKGGLFKVEYDRKLTKLADGMEGGTDGVEPVTQKEFLVSCWAGVIYYVYPDGTKEQLLDTRNTKFNSADIAYDPIARMIFVPTFWRNSVIAYELK